MMMAKRRTIPRGKACQTGLAMLQVLSLSLTATLVVTCSSASNYPEQVTPLRIPLEEWRRADSATIDLATVDLFDYIWTSSERVYANFGRDTAEFRRFLSDIGQYVLTTCDSSTYADLTRRKVAWANLLAAAGSPDTQAQNLNARLALFLRQAPVILRDSAEVLGEEAASRRMSYILRYCDIYSGNVAYFCESRLLDMAIAAPGVFYATMTRYPERFVSFLEHLQASCFTNYTDTTLKHLEALRIQAIQAIEKQEDNLRYSSLTQRLLVRLRSIKVGFVD